ncbi:hypothetical protein [Mesorhizobium sp. B2-5-7]|nr:hypothetical protein [Mesorhizobium sp. B2-5-7]
MAGSDPIDSLLFLIFLFAALTRIVRLAVGHNVEERKMLGKLIAV